jgi:predicted nucleic acid-binding Zn ribbon protein
MKKEGPTQIREILKVAIKKAEEQKKGLLSEEETRDAWISVVGADAAKHTKIKRLTKTTLTIDVDSPTWIYQFNINRERIEKRLNRRLKRKPTIKIRFRAGGG